MLRQDGPLIAIIVGAPGCGKTTLSPQVACLLDVAATSSLDADETSTLIDEFVDVYKDTALEQGRFLAPRFAASRGLDASHCGDPAFYANTRVAETADCSGYQDPHGRVRRELTAKANGLMLSRVIGGDATVLISGTGMALHRFLPLFERIPRTCFKFVLPIAGYRGFFNNSYQAAAKVRTGSAGEANGRYVDAQALLHLYGKQEEYLRPGGIWANARNPMRGADLVSLIGSQATREAQDEIAEIQAHFDSFCAMQFGRSPHYA